MDRKMKNEKENSKSQRFCFKQDQDSHWYLIPVSQTKNFDKLCEKAYKNEYFDEFESQFSEFRSESPFNYSFTDPKEN
jgi:hypothetical protein